MYTHYHLKSNFKKKNVYNYLKLFTNILENDNFF